MGVVLPSMGTQNDVTHYFVPSLNYLASPGRNYETIYDIQYNPISFISDGVGTAKLWYVKDPPLGENFYTNQNQNTYDIILCRHTKQHNFRS